MLDNNGSEPAEIAFEDNMLALMNLPKEQMEVRFLNRVLDILNNSGIQNDTKIEMLGNLLVLYNAIANFEDARNFSALLSNELILKPGYVKKLLSLLSLAYDKKREAPYSLQIEQVIKLIVESIQPSQIQTNDLPTIKNLVADHKNTLLGIQEDYPNLSTCPFFKELVGQVFTESSPSPILDDQLGLVEESSSFTKQETPTSNLWGRFRTFFTQASPTPKSVWTSEMLKRKWQEHSSTASPIQKACYEGKVEELDIQFKSLDTETFHKIVSGMDESNELPSSLHILCLTQNVRALNVLYTQWINSKVRECQNGSSADGILDLGTSKNCHGHTVPIDLAYTSAVLNNPNVMGELFIILIERNATKIYQENDSAPMHYMKLDAILKLIFGSLNGYREKFGKDSNMINIYQSACDKVFNSWRPPYTEKHASSAPTPTKVLGDDLKL